MNEYTNKKPLIITIVIAVILIIILAMQMRTPKNNKRIEKESAQLVNKLNMNDNCVEIIKTVLQRNQDWSNLPLSDNFKKKYNSKDGVLKDVVFDKIFSYNDSNDKENHEIRINIGYGYRYDDYYFKYILNDEDELDDLILLKKEVTQYDEGLHPTLAHEPAYVNERIFAREIAYLSSPRTLKYITDGEYDFVETTDNFKKKFGNGFGDESDFEYVDSVDAIDKISSWEDKIVYCAKYGKKKGTDEDFKKYYKINFTLDGNNRVDNVEVTDVSIPEIRRLCGTDKNED